MIVRSFAWPPANSTPSIVPVKSTSARSPLIAGRVAGFQDVARRSQFAGLGVDTEDHHVIGILMCGQQEGARRIDREVARCLAAGRSALHGRKRALGGIDGEHVDKVRSAGGAVDELPAGMDSDFGATYVRRHLGGGERL